jgi:hypothetical protein
MGEGGGGMDETQGGGGGMQNQGREGRRGRMAMGSLVLSIVREELASWRGAAAITIVAVAMAMARAATRTRKLADCQCVAERDEGDGR